MVTAYGLHNAFSRSSSRQEIRHRNNAWYEWQESGLDQDVKGRLNADDGADRNHGICSGITGAWIIGYLNGVEGARDPSKFKSHFDNVLRFQGAYMKDVGGRTDRHLSLLADNANFDAKIRKTDELTLTSVKLSDLPAGRKWAAYAAVWHHAIGIGGGDGFFIMEPNFGLFAYDSAPAFLSDFNGLIEARRIRKRRGVNDTIKLFVYGKD